MDLKQLLCMLLQTVCHSVTAVESTLGGTGMSGADKKAEATKGVTQFLDGILAQGVQFARDHVEAVASQAIDTVVGIAHDLGAFVHHSAPAAPKDGAP